MPAYTGHMATKTRLTLEQFLALPETEPPCEYITGELREKVSPNAFHAALAGELSRLLGNYLAETKLGRVFTELRHHSVALNRAYLPDISVILAPRVDEAFRQSGVAWPPDLAVEILSPDDRAADVLDKVDMYQQLDVALLWVVDPQARALREYRHGEAPRVHRSPSRVKAAPVLPGFELDLAALFAILPRED